MPNETQKPYKGSQATPPPPTLENAKTFAEFFPLYMQEHQHPLCRRMHFIGSILGIVGLLAFAATGRPEAIGAGIAAGYACAWVGHAGFEKNKPASFKRPWFSFLGDWAMFRDMLGGRLPF
tara:strand:- start:160 stop:522 length:363 start_codon:yes stop_codon:yes gene_type:complete